MAGSSEIMKITELAFTVLPVTNLAKARTFYEGVLGLKPAHIFEKDGMGMIEYSIGTGTLSIGSGAPIFKPAKDGGAVALEVEDFPGGSRLSPETRGSFHSGTL